MSTLQTFELLFAGKKKTELSDHYWAANSIHPCVYLAVHYTVPFSFPTTLPFHIQKRIPCTAPFL
jgi:hypothetical protein